MELENYECEDFITIEDGVIIWDCYYYDDGAGWGNVEYGKWETPITDFIHKYHNDPSEAYELEGSQFTQYQLLPWDNGYDADEMLAGLKNDLSRATLINPKDINENTPDGYYVLERIK